MWMVLLFLTTLYLWVGRSVSDTIFVLINTNFDIYIYERYFLQIYMMFHLFQFMYDVMLMDIYIFGFYV